VKPDIENIRGLIVEVVKLTTVQVTRLPLQHKICKTDMICSTTCTDRGFVRSANAICAKCTLDERPSILIRDKPIFSSERMLHKD
jgi:hypothetical protein